MTNSTNAIFRIAAALAVCIVTASCSASYPTQPTKANPVALYLAYSSPKGRAPAGPFIGTNFYGFIAYTIDADGAYERVTDRVAWSSSDDAIVRVQAGFIATGVKGFVVVAPGSASVIARFQGLETTAPVLVVQGEVLQRLPRIDLTASGTSPALIGSLTRGFATLRLLNGTSQDATNRATWSSSDPEVATVNESGSIRAVRSGTTIITANADGLVDWFWFSVLPGS